MTIAYIVMKLGGVIPWSWWWVLLMLFEDLLIGLKVAKFIGSHK